jgi:hypothetical protein
MSIWFLKVKHQKKKKIVRSPLKKQRKKSQQTNKQTKRPLYFSMWTNTGKNYIEKNWKFPTPTDDFFPFLISDFFYGGAEDHT